MPAPSPVDDVARRFGLEPISDSVQRLTQLIARSEAGSDEIASLIAQDKVLADRLLKVANPRAASEADYTVPTVEEALQRTGMSIALLLAMSAPLMQAVHKTFATMLGIELKPLPLTSAVPFDGQHLVGEVTFKGKVTGWVRLRLPPDAAPLIGARLLGLTPEDLEHSAVVDDVIGELCNIVTGNFKSNLCDAGLPCTLSPPHIVRTDNFRLCGVEGAPAERAAFHASELQIFADISVDPWSE